MAANIINEKRGWVQPKEIGIRHRQEISNCCMEILRAMDKFSWRQYKMELTKRGYKVHIQEMIREKFMVIQSNGVTQIINHPCWVSGEI